MNNSTHNLHANVDERVDRQTPPRHRTAFAISAKYKAALDGGDAIEALHDLLVDALEPREREIYQWFLADDGAGGAVYTARVAEHFGLQHHDCGMMLLFLTRLGLLERVEERDAMGRRFIYGLPGVKSEVFG